MQLHGLKTPGFNDKFGTVLARDDVRSNGKLDADRVPVLLDGDGAQMPQYKGFKPENLREACLRVLPSSRRLALLCRSAHRGAAIGTAGVAIRSGVSCRVKLVSRRYVGSVSRAPPPPQRCWCRLWQSAQSCHRVAFEPEENSRVDF